MDLKLQPTLSIGLILLLFAVPAGLTLLLYRQHRLERPWHIGLPLLRLAVFGLLAILFLRPVLVRERLFHDRGRIAVLVDNSGSMSVGDDYTLPEQVDITWRLGLFPPALRVNVFDAQRDTPALLSGRLNQAQQAAATWADTAGQPSPAGVAEADILLASLERLRRQSEDMHAALVDAIDNAAYLKNALAGKRPPPPAPKAFDPTSDWTSGGGLLLKRWDRLPGWKLEDLTGSDAFRGPADHAQLISDFAAPRNVGDHFGGQIQGYLRAPLTGEYVFLFTSDDQGVLMLSPDHLPDGKKQIASTPYYSESDDFSKYPQQTSEPIPLTAEQVYYIEALYKENRGYDHLVVGWIRPDGKREVPIPGDYLNPFGRVPRQRIGPPFRDLYEQYETHLAAFMGELERIREQTRLCTRTASADQRLRMLNAIRRDLSRLTGRLTAIEPIMGRLQRAADVELATADIDRVDQALTRFSRMKRHDIIRSLLLDKPIQLLERLNERGPTDLFSLDENGAPFSSAHLQDLAWNLPRTNLGTRVQDILRYYEDEPVSAILILSDGNNNAGKSLREAREIAGEREVLLLGLGFGAARPPRDIAIDRVVSPQSAFRDDLIHISVAVKRDGFTDRPIPLKLVSARKLLHHTVIPPGTENRITVDMVFRESRSGVLQYSLEAEVYDGEELSHNNRLQFQVNVLEDPIKTLLIDTFPRWETRFCQALLTRDTRVDLDTIFLDATLTPEGARLALPLSQQELFAYQVLILGDVDPAVFSPEQRQALRAFVMERGATLISMAGRHFMPDKYFGTELADLIPLRISAHGEPAPGESAGPVSVQALQVVAENRYDPLVQIGTDPAVSARLWRELPGLSWVKGGVTASRVADRLVESGDRMWPVVVRANVGQGKVLYLGSDSFWRWHSRGGREYYQRFWNQILLWAALGRTTGSGRFVKLMTSQPDYTPGETIDIHAQILDANELPLKNAQAMAEIFARETGNIVKIVELEYVPQSGGKYIGRIPELPRGKYRIIPMVEELKNETLSSEAFFEVRDLPTSEYVELKRNEARLQSFVSEYRPYERARELLDRIPEQSTERIERDEKELWSSFGVLIAAAFLLTLEWFLRRRNQLL